ncbi:hypothetical protein AXK11_01255 [Cephaloticoccus primus]|uniref:Uncharacterized protein n=1 Tax=Cephaloticoccus primus TaxID=1548207 RepID=A0A139SUA1_9BACT|nr:hypothetical protein [Cephaloticoccus primus]KXU38094.1 hypothetical protein AXK11_01255 [Cephaloticoccus primus]
MSLTLATLIPAALLLGLGLALLSGRAIVAALCKQWPRSSAAALLLFGGAALWFLYKVWHLPEADFGSHRTLLAIGFGAIAALSFKYVPDFLAVRGVAILVLLGASPLLDAAYMKYELPQRLFLVSLVYLAIALALYLGAVPYRLRDFFEWLFGRPARSRVFGAMLAAYGALLVFVATTY